ncbi:MAG: nitroreductase family protein [Agitococcus sp.]|nr:nitroreductase family protein [Agitococcus sp.]
MTAIATRIAEHNINPLFTNRWSPRAFTGEAIDKATLFSLFEAARWAPSANNSQPWRFIYALNGSQHWPEVFALLGENNQRWAKTASALVILVSKTSHFRKGASEATPLRSHSLDSGAAWASLAFQAEHAGWRTHAIGGFDKEKAREVLAIPDGFHVEVAIAIGKQAERSTLSAELQEREQPNQRKAINEIVAEGRFNFNE